MFDDILEKDFVEKQNSINEEIVDICVDEEECDYVKQCDDCDNCSSC